MYFTLHKSNYLKLSCYLVVKFMSLGPTRVNDASIEMFSQKLQHEDLKIFIFVIMISVQISYFSFNFIKGRKGMKNLE